MIQLNLKLKSARLNMHQIYSRKIQLAKYNDVFDGPCYHPYIYRERERVAVEILAICYKSSILKNYILSLI